MKSSADSLLRILNDVLDFSKIEAGKLDLECIDFDLRETVGAMAKTVALRAHDRGLEMACHILSDVPNRILGDPLRLRQVLLNIVGNAIKFTEAGEVLVQVRCERRTVDSVLLHFEVRDTGIGIPLEKQKLIFEAFAQADGSTTRRYGGTGLGLTISSELVQKMGGRIWVESQPGKGSTFCFDVPFGLAAQQEKPSQSGPIPSLENLRVLVVDDNPTNRHILQEMLGNWGMKPALADSGPAALALLKMGARAGRPFPLVVLDVMMPEMDGYTVAAKIKQDPATAASSILMLTSGNSRGEAQRCRELGIAAFMVKPIQQSELFDAIITGLTPVNAVKEVKRPADQALSPTRRPLRILLAEDNVVNQRVAVMTLEKIGHKVCVVGHGKAALAKLETEEIDVVLMDVQMPIMSGEEATARIREQERDTGRHMPIIAMTAHAMKGDRERLLRVGMDDYLAKPIQSAELMRILARFTPDEPPSSDEPEPFGRSGGARLHGRGRQHSRRHRRSLPRRLPPVARADSGGCRRRRRRRLAPGGSHAQRIARLPGRPRSGGSGAPVGGAGLRWRFGKRARNSRRVGASISQASAGCRGVGNGGNYRLAAKQCSSWRLNDLSERSDSHAHSHCGRRSGVAPRSYGHASQVGLRSDRRQRRRPGVARASKTRCASGGAPRLDDAGVGRLRGGEARPAVGRTHTDLFHHVDRAGGEGRHDCRPRRRGPTIT